MPLIRKVTFRKGLYEKEEIIYNETTNYGHTPEQDCSYLVQVHKYEVKGTMSPSLITDSNGKKFIVPYWIECHPKTELTDIKYTAPVKRPRADVNVKSSDGKYKVSYNTITKKYKCDCMGFWRSKGNCKHVKELREKML